MKKISIFLLSIIGNQVFAACENKTMELLKIPVDDIFNTPVSSSTKSVLAIKEAPSTISVYDYKDIRRYGVRKISDLLLLIAGVQVQTRSNGRENVWIRGVQSDFDSKLALFVDNVPIRDVFGGFPVDEALPVEMIEKIEIIKGPGSTLYGANAFSGVINIYRFQAGNRQFDTCKSYHASNTVRAGIGEQNTYTGNFSLQHNIADVLDVMIEGKGLQTDGRTPAFDRTGIANSRPNQQNMGYLRFNTSALKGELLFNVSYDRFQNDRVDRTAPTDDTQTDKNLRVSLSYKHQFSGNFGLEANIYHNDTERHEHEQLFNTKNQSFKGTAFVDDVLLSGIYSAFNYRPIKSNQLITGFEVRRDELVKSDYTDNTTGQISSYIVDGRYQNNPLVNSGLFLQDTQEIGAKTRLTVGLRYDILELFKNQFNYRLGLTHDFTDSIYGKLLYGTAYRTPTFIEFARAPAGFPLPDVETMKTMEATVGLKDKSKRVSLTAFNNNYDNFLVSNKVVNLASPVNDVFYNNQGKRHMYGVEFESQAYLPYHFNAFVNTSWTHAESGDGQDLPLIANWTTATGIEWRGDFSFGEFVFNNQLVIYGKRNDWSTDIWKPGQQQRYANRSSGLNDGFSVWNLALNYKLPLSKEKTVTDSKLNKEEVIEKQTLRLELSVHNLLNKQYFTQSLSVPVNNAPAYFDSEYQGRQLRFYVSYSW